MEKRRHDDKKKADLQSEQFMSVYVKEDVENIPRLGCFFKVNFAVHYSGHTFPLLQAPVSPVCLSSLWYICAPEEVKKTNKTKQDIGIKVITRVLSNFKPDF